MSEDALHFSSHVHGMLISSAFLVGLSPILFLSLRDGFFLCERTFSAGIRRGFALCLIIVVSLGGFFFFPIFFGHHHHEQTTHISPGMLAVAGVLAITLAALSLCINFLSRSLTRREAELLRMQELAKEEELLVSLSTVAAGAAHELCSPLTTIAIIAKELERDAEKRKLLGESDCLRIQDDALTIRRELEKCRAIIDSMNDPLKDEFPLADDVELRAVLEQATSSSKRRRPAVTCRLTANVSSVHAPEVLLVRIVQNLVENAVDASADGQEVIVDFENAFDEFHIRVEDFGSGMSQDQLSRVGEPYFTTKKPRSGTGLGLFLVRALVRRFGATMKIDAKPDGGTIVSVTLLNSKMAGYPENERRGYASEIGVHR